LFGLLLLALTASAANGAEPQPKRVLIVHSFGSTAPPFTTHSTAFQITLTKGLGGRVDMDEVSLDMARYAQPDMEGPFVEFLLTRLAKWQPDLVVPIGSPAGRFVVKYRDRLFPGAPIIYTGMDRRTLPDDAVQSNATFVGESFNLAGLVEDILQLAPDTNHIAVVIGASPLERFWTTTFQKAFEPFQDRVRFSWLNDLSFDDLLQRVATLPPRSFVLLALLIRDASGVTHNQDEALQQLRAVTNAPINGLYQNQLGMGVVGGRLYQAEAQGEAAAHIAIRVLRGEPISKFPPQRIPTLSPRYDWRELRRWNISEDRLPARQRDPLPPADALAGIPLAYPECDRPCRGAGGTHRHAARSAPTPPRGPGGPGRGSSLRDARERGHCGVRHRHAGPARRADPRRSTACRDVPRRRSRQSVAAR
jgi:hypothetical protein